MGVTMTKEFVLKNTEKYLNIPNCSKIPICKKYTKLSLGVTLTKGFVLKTYLKNY